MTEFPPNAVFPPPVRQPLMPPPGLPGEPADASAATPAAKPDPVKIAVLRFLDPASVSKTVAVKFPFAYRGEGGEEIEVSAVPVRRLSVAEVGAIITGKTADTLDLFEFYAAMTGLPTEVLRAMPSDEEVVDECRPFLPPPVRDLLEALSLPFGGASPLPPPDPAGSPSDES